MDRPVVSLSFDDVPLSAFEIGVPILEASAVKATFYVCLGIEGASDERFIGADEIVALSDAGHEIGCHTFSHYRLATGSARGLVRDAIRNKNALGRLIGEKNVSSFSFPFGEVSLSAKRALRGEYDSLRSSRPGINRRTIDLACLRSFSVQRDVVSVPIISAWLDDLQEKGGWAIFYTHGVSRNPGYYDVRPEGSHDNRS